MKCEWGGCQSEAVVRVQPMTTTLVGDYEPVSFREPRATCRSHMAIVCADYPVNLVETLS